MTESIHDHESVATARPIVRLRPRKGQRFAAGAPWIFNDELVLDRRTRALAAGTLTVLESADRQPLGTVAVNPAATLAARLIDRDPAAEPDAAWFAARLNRALGLREALFTTPFYRLVHAEADGLPGVIVDRFGDAVVVQPNAAWAEARLDALLAALDAVVAPRVVVINGASRVRALEGLSDETRVVRGALDGPVEVAMNGALYLADLTGGQKTGLFYDQRPNHAAVAALARGASVLDVFCHVGGFGLAALAGGAARVLAVDSAAPALALASEGAARMGVAARFETRRGGAFDVLHALDEEACRFGVVICDPPAFAPNKQALQAGLRAYLRTARLAARLVEPDGWLVLCSCSHAADPARFAATCAEGIAAAGRQAVLVHEGRAGPDHPVHMALPETRYLKTLIWRMQG